MRRIDKGKEPPFLTEYRLRAGEPPPTYEDLPAKGDLRETLIARQGHLCCYCQARITPERATIEHFRPQSRSPEEGLTWRNLWAACEGNRGSGYAFLHCDARKGDMLCDLDPATVVDEQFGYRADGTVHHADPQLTEQLDRVLNLNERTLRQRRKAAAEGMLQALAKQRPGGWSRQALLRQIERLDAEGELQPYLTCLLYWLRRRLKRG